MSKIICDICGTSYPESGTQCPICGSVRPADLNAVLHTSETAEERPNGSYTHVRGGRFSKANVKKRNQGKNLESVEPAKKVAEPDKKPKKKSDIWFVVVIVALLAAIVAVVIYIAVRFFVPALDTNEPPAADTTPSTTEQTQETTTGPLEILCEEITLNKTVIEFDRVDAAIYLKATVTPEDTAEDIYFVSSDDTVAIVGADGRVKAVGAGEATITVYCGSIEATCRVVCNFEPEDTVPETSQATDPTEATTIPVTSDKFKLNRSDFTIGEKGGTWDLYDGDIPADQIVWTTDDEKVATIKDGVVTAVGAGYTTVHGEYQGTKVDCIVRCNFVDVTPGENENPGNDNTEVAKCIISHTDVTIKINERFTLTLVDENGNPVNVTWRASDSSICSISNNFVTGTAPGMTTVSATYNGVAYSCIVRVS